MASRPNGRLLTVLSLLLGVVSLPPWAVAADITGKRPFVVDGDTIELGGVRIRLFGIDAPATEQTCRADGKDWNCGQEARWAIANRIGRNWVACRERARERGGAVVAVCYLGGIGGPELNGWLVEQGWALAARSESPNYLDHEGRARRAGRGLWRGSFVAPWDWRAPQ